MKEFPMHFKTRILCLKTEIGTAIFNVGAYSHFYYYYYYYYLLQLSFHSVAVVLTIVKNKNIHI